MPENSVKTLLKHIADAPEPVSAVDIAAARRRGRRRLVLRRFAAPALAVVAVAAAVTVPRAIFSSAGERAGGPLSAVTVSAPRVTRPLVAMPRSASARFNPLVPYAAFGWLPAGFAEDAIPLSSSGMQNSGPTEVDRAAVAADGRMVRLAVYAKGACAKPRPWRTGGVAAQQSPTACVYSTGKAPDVNGRPALWIPDGIAWEYAPGAWAAVYAEPAPAKSGGHHAARTAGSAGPYRPPVMLAATKALVAKVASTVKYAQTTPLLFSFKLTTPLPSGWRLSEMGYHVRDGRLLADALNAGPAADTSALSISAATQSYACDFVDGQSSYVTKYGVNWEYRVMIDHIAKNIRMLCSMEQVDGLQLGIYLDMAPEEAGAPPLPGSTQLGGAFGVYEKLHLLGPDPANWTASPLG